MGLITRVLSVPPSQPNVAQSLSTLRASLDNAFKLTPHALTYKYCVHSALCFSGRDPSFNILKKDHYVSGAGSVAVFR